MKALNRLLEFKAGRSLTRLTLPLILAASIGVTNKGISVEADFNKNNSKQFVIRENFDSQPNIDSVGNLPGWTSYDASGNYDHDATVIQGYPVEPAHSEPGYMRLVGYQTNVPASAILKVSSHEKIKTLSLSFFYELQSNANGKVEISNSSEGPWIDAGLPLEKDYRNDIEHWTEKDLTSLLKPAKIKKEAYIRWSNQCTRTDWVVFNVDDIQVSGNFKK